MEAHLLTLEGRVKSGVHTIIVQGVTKKSHVSISHSNSSPPFWVDTQPKERRMKEARKKGDSGIWAEEYSLACGH